MSMSKLAESFMTTKDEAFLGLGCGTYCICYNWDEHNRLGVFACNLADKTCSYLSRSGLQHAKGEGSSKDLYISHGPQLGPGSIALYISNSNFQQHRRLQVEIDHRAAQMAPSIEFFHQSNDGLGLCCHHWPPDESWTLQQIKDDEHMAEIKFQDGKLYAMGREYVVVSDPLEVLDQ
ncbi:uncharacterized protein LOC121052402 [Rosa chinensis]|uniref:uncharacterized protein LOC121052402 n=1 Tax=Rosa chinensis TaxID=74649 RepID=UPI001AD913F5|nr:uncharacterized protein LOC121052402 [Rosa chinensis]